MTTVAPAHEHAPTRRRFRHPARWVAGAVLLVLAVVAVVAATRPSYQASQVDSPLLTRPAPAISGTTLAGRSFSLSSYRGRYVYVNFFASWCPPCQKEEPNLIDFAFHQQQASGGAAVVSVVFNDSVPAARQFVTQWGAEWPAVADTGGAIANRYGVESPPMTFLVDPRGRIVGTWAGPVTAGQLQSMLTAVHHRQGGGGGG
ncbi:MAG: TlpA family protein disulfide reductase [Acidimicrobiales bacterium]